MNNVYVSCFFILLLKILPEYLNTWIQNGYFTIRKQLEYTLFEKSLNLNLILLNKKLYDLKNGELCGGKILTVFS